MNGGIDRTRIIVQNCITYRRHKTLTWFDIFFILLFSSTRNTIIQRQNILCAIELVERRILFLLNKQAVQVEHQ